MLKTGPEVERQLYEKLSNASNGFDHNIVVGATINVLVNAIRQNCATREQAERLFDELFGKSKHLLMEKHYDAVSGKRRNIFPFTQVVHAQRVVDKQGL